MRMLIVVKILIGLLVATIGFPTPQVLANGNDRLAVSLCEGAAANNRSVMRKKLKQARLRLRDIYDGLRCGKQGSLARVAINADAMEAAKYIFKKSKKEALTKVDSDGKNILQYAQGLVAAGDSSKQAYVDLIQSL